MSIYNFILTGVKHDYQRFCSRVWVKEAALIIKRKHYVEHARKKRSVWWIYGFFLLSNFLFAAKLITPFWLLWKIEWECMLIWHENNDLLANYDFLFLNVFLFLQSLDWNRLTNREILVTTIDKQTISKLIQHQNRVQSNTKCQAVDFACVGGWFVTNISWFISSWFIQ